MGKKRSYSKKKAQKLAGQKHKISKALVCPPAGLLSTSSASSTSFASYSSIKAPPTKKVYYHALYAGWKYVSPLFESPTHALCWQIYRFYRDGGIHYWENSAPVWMQYVGATTPKEEVKKTQFQWRSKSEESFFSNVPIYLSEEKELQTDFIKLDERLYIAMLRQFSFPDYFSSAQSILRSNKTEMFLKCNMQFQEIKRNNAIGVPTSEGENGLIRIGNQIEKNLLNSNRSLSK